MLIGHGSRDPRSAIALARLAESLSLPQAPVATALLECQTQPLSHQLADLAAVARRDGRPGLVLYPLFLLAGHHVCEDIPTEVAIARTLLEAVPIQVQPALGEHPDLGWLLASQLPEQRPCILVAHGSRRPGALVGVEQLAARLGARLAFWAQDPHLSDLLAVNPEPAVVIPYFLFPGGITDTLATAIAAYPGVTLLPPLGELPGFESLLRTWLGLKTTEDGDDRLSS